MSMQFPWADADRVTVTSGPLPFSRPCSASFTTGAPTAPVLCILPGGHDGAHNSGVGHEWHDKPAPIRADEERLAPADAGACQAMGQWVHRGWWGTNF